MCYITTNTTVKSTGSENTYKSDVSQRKKKKVQELSNRLGCSSVVQHLSRMCKALGSIIKTLGRNYHVIQQFHFGAGVPKISAIRVLKRYFHLSALLILFTEVLFRTARREIKPSTHQQMNEHRAPNRRKMQLRNTMNIANVRLLLTQTVLQKKKNQNIFTCKKHTLKY